MKKILAVLLAITLLFSFPITAQAASVAKVSGVKVTATTTDSVSLKWKKANGAKGYLVYCSTNKTKGFKKVKTIKKGKTVKATIKKLGASKTYYFKVRAYRGKTKGKFSKVVKAKTKAVSNVPIVPLKVGNTYYNDLTRDGKKDKITVKQISEYGTGDYYFESQKDVYVNGVKAFSAIGYKGINLWIYTNNQQSVVVYQAVAGTASTTVGYYYYNAGKYTKESLYIDDYYYQRITYSGNYFVVIHEPKYSWFSTCDSIMSFDGPWDFDVRQNYTLTDGMFVKAHEYPYAYGKTQYVSNNTFRTSLAPLKTMKNDGVIISKGESVTLLNVYNDGVTYYYKIKSSKGTGWFKGSSSIILKVK